MANSRSVLITGASRGIGLACALGLAARGWRGFAGVRHEDDGQALRDAAGKCLTPVRLDITSARQIDVVHALESSGPKTRYLTIRGGWAFRLATNLVPDRWRDSLVRRVMAHYLARRPG